MPSWPNSFLGIRALPRDLSEFELLAFFRIRCRRSADRKLSTAA